jgi:hypothetical protein
MSTLGEYIHYQWANYQKYGITRSNKSGAISYGGVSKIF